MLVIVGDSTVSYRGRAASELGWGERLIVVKNDGSIIIHRPWGYEPVNWQPSGSTFEILRNKDGLLLRFVRRSPREILDLSLRRILTLSSLNLIDNGQFDMLMREQELYSVLEKNPQLIDEGFRIISAQKDKGVGIVDFTGTDREGNYAVVEVKKDPATEEAVKQLYKYLVETRKTVPKTRGILVAPALKGRAKRLLKELNLEFRQINLKKMEELVERKDSLLSERLDKHLATSTE